MESLEKKRTSKGDLDKWSLRVSVHWLAVEPRPLSMRDGSKAQVRSLCTPANRKLEPITSDVAAACPGYGLRVWTCDDHQDGSNKNATPVKREEGTFLFVGGRQNVRGSFGFDIVKRVGCSQARCTFQIDRRLALQPSWHLQCRVPWKRTVWSNYGPVTGFILDRWIGMERSYPQSASPPHNAV